MKQFLTLLPFALSALAVAPMANPEPVQPASGAAPAGCSPSYSGSFTISNTRLPGSRKRTPPQEGPASTVELTLADGVLRDSVQRFGYIASNHQFQFDNPIQAGSLITTGWSACSNNTLALGSTTTFYQCISGNFYNIYNTPIRSGCIPIELAIVPSSGSSVVPVSSTYVAPTSAAPATSTYAVLTVTSPTPAPTLAPSPVTAVSTGVPAPAATSTAPAPGYTGAANALAVDGSFFAMAAGAVALAMF